MSEPPFEPEVPVSAYGAARRAAWLQHAADLQEAASGASLEAHRATSATLRAAHTGLFQDMSPQELGAAVAARPGRPLERLGGTFDHAATGPAPARVDLRFVDQHQPPGISPVLAYMQGRDR